MAAQVTLHTASTISVRRRQEDALINTGSPEHTAHSQYPQNRGGRRRHVWPSSGVKTEKPQAIAAFEKPLQQVANGGRK